MAPEGGITFLSYEPGSRCLPSYVALGFIPSNIPNFTQHVLCARLLTCFSIQGSEKFTFQPSKEHFTAQSVIGAGVLQGLLLHSCHLDNQ